MRYSDAPDRHAGRASHARQTSSLRSRGSGLKRFFGRVKRFFFVEKDGRVTKTQVAVHIGLGLVLLGGFLYISVLRLGLKLDFGTLWDFRLRIWKGFYTTIWLALASMAVSLLIGFVAALGSRSQLLAARYLCKIYVSFIRGTPLIAQIYLFYYIIGTAWGVNNRLLAGVIILSVFEGAYITEIIRGGMESIEATQLEAAAAVGFSRWQTMRFVELPQVTSRVLPGLAGQFASIIKDSSLLSLIAVAELTQTIREITATNYAFFVAYFLLAALYFALTFPITLLARWLEGRFHYEA